jgi:hypothetical protein
VFGYDSPTRSLLNNRWGALDNFALFEHWEMPNPSWLKGLHGSEEEHPRVQLRWVPLIPTESPSFCQITADYLQAARLAFVTAGVGLRTQQLIREYKTVVATLTPADLRELDGAGSGHGCAPIIARCPHQCHPRRPRPYEQHAEFADRDGNIRFEELVLGALREAHPELFDGGAA